MSGEYLRDRGSADGVVCRLAGVPVMTPIAPEGACGRCTAEMSRRLIKSMSDCAVLVAALCALCCGPLASSCQGESRYTTR